MTLIAAFRSHGTPVLVGDFLLSCNGQRAGARKKICRLGQNLAIGWSGHVLAAKCVIDELSQQIREGQLRIAELEKLFTGLNVAGLGSLSVHIIGWLVEGDAEHCFLWNSQYPTELFYGDPKSAGSGDFLIDRIIGPRGFVDGDEPSKVDPERGIFSVLDVTTRLMGDEILLKENNEIGVGHAYEALVWEQDHWRYLDDILYFAATAEFDSNDVLKRAEISGAIYKYHVRDECSIVEIFSADRAFHDLSVMTVPKIGMRESALRLAPTLVQTRRGRPFPFESKYYCVFFRAIAPNYVGPTTVFLIEGGEAPPEKQFVQIDPSGKFALRFSDEQIHMFYRQVRDDYEKQAQPGQSEE